MLLLVSARELRASVKICARGAGWCRRAQGTGFCPVLQLLAEGQGPGQIGEGKSSK